MNVNSHKSRIVYLNGEFLDLEKAFISVLDRGFIFGDGVYEVIPVYNRKPFLADDHLHRFKKNISLLRIDIDRLKINWEKLIYDLIGFSVDSFCVVYLQVTRGAADREHGFPKKILPTVFGMTYLFNPPSQDLREKGLRVISVNDDRWLNCNIKSTSLLGNVLAKQKATDLLMDDVIQFRNNYLTEASSSNVWIVKKGILVTPPNNRLILEGIRYKLILNFAKKLSIPFEIRSVNREEVIYESDELFLTSATKEILPVLEIDGRELNSRKPGEIYYKLREAYDQEISFL